MDIDGILSLTGVGDDEVCCMFIYNEVIWWAFRGVILHYLLINPKLYEDIFSVGGCMYYIGVIVSHIGPSFLGDKRLHRVDTFL